MENTEKKRKHNKMILKHNNKTIHTWSGMEDNKNVIWKRENGQETIFFCVRSAYFDHFNRSNMLRTKTDDDDDESVCPFSLCHGEEGPVCFAVL